MRIVIVPLLVCSIAVAAEPPKPAEQVYKNIQVLKGVAGGVTGVIPPLERSDDDGIVQFGQVKALGQGPIGGTHNASGSPYRHP